MRKKREQGFTLVEVIIVVAIIGVISTFAIPKVREHLAKSKDAKAVVLLSRLRMASEMHFAEKGKALGIGDGGAVTADSIDSGVLAELLGYLDEASSKSFGEGKNEVEIGGQRKGKEGDLTYGGTIRFTFENPDSTSGIKGDGIYIWFDKGDENTHSTSGKAWKDY